MKTVLALLAFLTHSMAFAVCFTDAKSYAAVKSQLPESFRNGSLSLTSETNTLTAAAQIKRAGKGFRFEMAYLHVLLGKKIDSGKVKEVCLDKSKLTVTLLNGTKKTLGIRGSGFEYEGYALSTSNVAHFKAAKAKIQAPATNGDRKPATKGKKK